MTPAQFEYSVFSSVLAIAVYLAVAVLHRQTPDLTHAMIIATSCSSAVAAVFVGIMTYTTPSDQLGVLRDHKAVVVTGALALIWVSAGAAYNSLMHPRRSASQTKRTA